MNERKTPQFLPSLPAEQSAPSISAGHCHQTLTSCQADITGKWPADQ